MQEGHCEITYSAVSPLSSTTLLTARLPLSLSLSLSSLFITQLLGLESDDLDICISSLTGHHFATLLEGYLQELREGPDGNNDSALVMQSTRIAKIQANPDQSKHLETARMTVGGLEIDLVQLRSEEYADGGASSNGEEGTSGSRIPTSVVGFYLTV